MPLIPMDQTVSVIKKKVDEEGKPILDRNRKPIIDYSYAINCSVKEGSFLVQDKSLGMTTNETVIGRIQIKFDELVDINYSDEIEYINEINHKYHGMPKEINIKRFFGKPIMTEVVL